MEIIKNLYLPRIRQELDELLNGGGVWNRMMGIPRKEIVNVERLTDDQVLELWKIQAL